MRAQKSTLHFVVYVKRDADSDFITVTMSIILDISEDRIYVPD